MAAPISILLDEHVHDELERRARTSGIELPALLRDIVTLAAHQTRQFRIRQSSEAIGRRAAAVPKMARFYADWGAQHADSG